MMRKVSLLKKELKKQQKPPGNLQKKTPLNNLAFSINETQSGLDGVFINEKHQYNDFVKIMSRDVASGFHPIGTNSIKAQADHEIGHQVNILFDLQNSKEFLALYSSYSEKQIKVGLSRYAVDNEMKFMNKDEFIAEAWAEYINNPNPRKIAKALGDIIIKMFSRKI